MKTKLKTEFKTRQTLPTLKPESPAPPQGPVVPRANLPETKRFDMDAATASEDAERSQPRSQTNRPQATN